jgi:hypothetical protein
MNKNFSSLLNRKERNWLCQAESLLACFGNGSAKNIRFNFFGGNYGHRFCRPYGAFLFDLRMALYFFKKSVGGTL